MIEFSHSVWFLFALAAAITSLFYALKTHDKTDFISNMRIGSSLAIILAILITFSDHPIVAISVVPTALVLGFVGNQIAKPNKRIATTIGFCLGAFLVIAIFKVILASQPGRTLGTDDDVSMAFFCVFLAPVMACIPGVICSIIGTAVLLPFMLKFYPIVLIVGAIVSSLIGIILLILNFTIKKILKKSLKHSTLTIICSFPGGFFAVYGTYAFIEAMKGLA